MAIKISGTTVIDDSKNIVNANDMFVGAGITMNASSGDVSVAGTITAAGINVPLQIVSFNPADGEIDVSPDSNITITFNQLILKTTTGIGSTANVEIRSGFSTGTILETIAVSSDNVTLNGSVVTINPTTDFPLSDNVYVVIDASAFNNAVAESPLIDTYNFTVRDLALGDPYEGGYLICQAGSVQWIVSPYSSEVSRNWYSRNDATTTAQSITGCADWFIPSYTFLVSPGSACNVYWDCYSSGYYWSSTSFNTSAAWCVNIQNGFCTCDSNFFGKSDVRCVRSFRCVSY